MDRVNATSKSPGNRWSSKTSPPLPSPSFALPDDGFVREARLLPVVGFSSSTLWRKVKSGEFPAPVRLGKRITAWKCSSVRAWINSASEVNFPPAPRPNPSGRRNRSGASE